MKQQLLECTFLSAEFYKHYNSVQYPEMLHKMDRPYIVCLVKINNLIFAIPFRSNIKHNDAFIISKKHTGGNKKRSGIDFSKTVVINNKKFVEKNRKPHITREEFIFLNSKDFLIIKGLKKFISAYKRAFRFNKKDLALYKFSSLQYFHIELGLEQEKHQ
jgi:protein AbiQ